MTRATSGGLATPKCWRDACRQRYHQPMLRLAIVVLTLFTLPAYGLAGVMQRSCQEEMRASHHVVLTSDCCPGKSEPGTPCKQLGDSHPGKKDSCTTCKAGYNCKSPHSYEPVEGFLVLLLPARPTLFVDPPSIVSPHSPDGLWRPPRLI